MNRLIRCFFCFAEDAASLKELSGHYPEAARLQVEDAIAVMAVWDFANAEELAERSADLSKLDSNLQELYNELIGYSTILISNEKLADVVFGGEQPMLETDLYLGGLKFNVAERTNHSYVFEGAIDPGNWDVFWRGFLRFDLQVFKVSYQAFLYQEQLGTMTDERKRLDEIVGGVLFTYSAGQKTDEMGMDLWESNIHDLAGALSVLGSYLPVITRMESTLSRELDVLYKYLKKIKDSVPDSDLLVNQTAGWVKTRIGNLRKMVGDITDSRDNAYAAMSVVQTQLGLVRAKQEMALQEQMGEMLRQNVNLLSEGVALQVAAAFIEFIVVNYYSLSIWKTVAPEDAFHHIPGWLKLIPVVMFAGTAVVCTHFAAQRILHKSKKASLGLGASVLALVIILSSMVVLSMVY